MGASRKKKKKKKKNDESVTNPFFGFLAVLALVRFFVSCFLYFFVLRSWFSCFRFFLFCFLFVVFVFFGFVFLLRLEAPAGARSLHWG